MHYEARYCDKQGKVRDHVFAETREAAALELFARNPNCRVASCCNAYRDPYTGELRANGSDCRWLSRLDFAAELGEPRRRF
jgi:hypothetical protein